MIWSGSDAKLDGVRGWGRVNATKANYIHLELPAVQVSRVSFQEGNEYAASRLLPRRDTAIPSPVLRHISTQMETRLDGEDSRLEPKSMTRAT